GPRDRRSWQKLSLERLEDRLTPSITNVSITGSSANDSLVINASNANSGTYSLNGGTPIAFSGLNSFTFTHSGQPNNLTLHNPSGGGFGPSGGIFYNGGGHGALITNGGSFTHVSYTSTNSHDGSINQDGAIITYTGLAPITDNNDTVNREFDFTGGPETITLG